MIWIYSYHHLRRHIFVHECCILIIVLYLAGEVQEMVDLYKSKGFSEEEARDILKIMAKYKNFFVDHMMTQVIMSIDCLFLRNYYYV